MFYDLWARSYGINNKLEPQETFSIPRMCFIFNDISTMKLSSFLLKVFFATLETSFHPEKLIFVLKQPKQSKTSKGICTFFHFRYDVTKLSNTHDQLCVWLAGSRALVLKLHTYYSGSKINGFISLAKIFLDIIVLFLCIRMLLYV